MFEIHKERDTSKVTGTMNVELPEDVLEEELQQIQKVLEESISNVLGKDPKDVIVKILPTGDATYDIFVGEPAFKETKQDVKLLIFINLSKKNRLFSNPTFLIFCESRKTKLSSHTIIINKDTKNKN